jgi:glycosyltransferase involved in cell wall biosynthesis
MNKLSVAIITKNEEKNIERCLKSISFADEIVVVDSGSQDRTREICLQYGANVITSAWLGFAETKQFAVDQCKNDWILVLDADEEITSKLEKKILSILQNPSSSGYRIKRKSFYLGKMIEHCGWNSDYTLRLFKADTGRFNNRKLHESIIIRDGKIGRIEESMLHYTYPTLESHFQKMLIYARLGAEQDFAAGKRSTWANAVFRGLIKFLKMYLLQQGFRDGRSGFLLSLNSALGVYLKYLYIWQMTDERVSRNTH